MKKTITTLCVAAAAGLLVCGTLTAAGTAKPNIIVILTDDHGYADLGCQKVVSDVRTPNLDRIAREGVRCTAAYVTAPQCVPSRAGLLSGRYQQRFGLDNNLDRPFTLEVELLPSRLKKAGYTTGLVGKWHLEPARVTPAETAPYLPGPRGFTDFFCGYQNTYLANYDRNGATLAADGQEIRTRDYRIDVQSDAACAFIRRRHKEPFFLYVAYSGPHTPLEAPEKYVTRFPGPMPERRRMALAMLAAIDDGVGRILATLASLSLEEKTLIIFTSDNGAPLYLNKPDAPLGEYAGWDGSVNDPWAGEKGMLTEGGIRVPFIARWPEVLPAGKSYHEPVSTLDIATTALAAAGQPHTAGLDGVNLIPFLAGESSGAPHEFLYWRFFSQAAVRSGRWKFLRLSNGNEYLFDLASADHENRNMMPAHPKIAAHLKERLAAWAGELKPAGLRDAPLRPSETQWFSHFNIGAQ